MIRFAIAGMALLFPAASFAQPPGARDPDWPCQQIKVPELSMAAVWSGPPVDPNDTTWRDDAAVSGLVEQLAPRRVPMERAQALLHDFAQHAGEQKNKELLQVLGGLFSVLGQERDSVIAGLDRFGGRQKELATQIRKDNEKLREMQKDTASDPNALQQMTQQVTWQVEVFQDRRQALSYACDVPGKIEQRLFALAHQIQAELN